MERRKHAMKQHSESGMTLVEILASIVILTIILSIVFMVFIQTAKTTNTTETTIDATYIGQTEMERVYAASRQSSYDTWEPAEPFFAKDSEANWQKIYTRQATEDIPFRIILKLNKQDNDMIRVLIRVYEADEQNDEKPIVQMENLYKWEKSESS